MSSGLLVVTAVPAEAEAIRAGLVPDVPVTVAPVGVGPASAAAGTARLIALAEAAGRPYRAVVSAGVGGGFPERASLGTIVLATRSVAADLGAESPEGFLPIEELGMPLAQLGAPPAIPADPSLLAQLRTALPRATAGAVLTLSTVTGTAETAKTLATRFPDAVAEAMEGYGVAVAAAQAELPFAEVRAVSNPVGPRDRGAWRLREAFDALTAAAANLG
ncbi:futalosine hydrolase [Micromonospora sp. NPDC049559]|uniref:futalosine hydrolase n=1 Tax=Micromonospora sp. NPDC049559 TaxID=3155923 RepID=UPI003448DBBE